MTIAEMTEQEMMQDARQDAEEVMKGGIVDIAVCSHCHDHGLETWSSGHLTLAEVNTVTVFSRLDYQFCGVCFRYQETPHLVEFAVESVIDYRFVRTEDSTPIYQTSYKVSKCEVLI